MDPLTLPQREKRKREENKPALIPPTFALLICISREEEEHRLRLTHVGLEHCDLDEVVYVCANTQTTLECKLVALHVKPG